jgi:hypothetical protein
MPGLKREFASIEELRRYTFQSKPLGLGVASSVVSKHFKDHRLDTRKNRGLIRREIESSWHVYVVAKHHFSEHRPDRAYVFNGRIASHKPVIWACTDLGIPFYGYEVAGTMGRYVTRLNTIPHNIEAITREIRDLWENAPHGAAETAAQWFDQRRAGMDQGCISFTKNQSSGQLPPGFDRSKRNIAIFNSTIEEYVAVEGWENTLYSPDETAGIRRILDSFREEPGFFFYLRVHPNLATVPEKRNSQLQDIRTLAGAYPNLRVIWPETRIHSYALMDACDTTVTFGSTIGAEATYWGKPSILAGKALYQDLGCCYIPQTHEALISLLRTRDLPPKPRQAALMYGYREMAYGTPFVCYMPSSPSSGLFMGVRVDASTPARILLILPRIRRKIGRLLAGMI